MPPAKPSQSGGAFYAAITFVALFIVALAAAVFFGLKVDQYKTQAESMQQTLDEVANPAEQRNLSKLVGKPQRGESYIGTAVGYLNDLVSAITGKQMSKDTPASVKVNDAKMMINDMNERLGEDLPTAYGPEGVDLVHTIDYLKTELDNARKSANELEGLLDNLQEEYDIYVQNIQTKQEELMQENERIQSYAQQIQQSYDDLKKQMEEASDQQLQTYMENREQAQDELKELQNNLQQTRSQLEQAQQDLRVALSQIKSIKPSPDIETDAFKADASIINVDPSAGVVYLDVGTEDRAYRGLTFSVYDSSVPIPEDGKGKAELEIFKITPQASAAKIISSTPTNPVVRKDLVANLIWDKNTSNQFVVTGAFDFDRDGKLDPDGKEKVIQLIEKWGGTIEDKVDINTDFVVLGEEASQMPQPTAAQLEQDPMLQSRYEQAQEDNQRRERIIQNANELAVPIFNQERFFHLIGYSTIAQKSTPL